MSRKPRPHKCQWCKVEFMAVQPKPRFCSYSCRTSFGNKFYKPVPFYTWCNGYCLMVARGHPYARPHDHRVKRARLMMEQILGRYLSRDEVVHHKDGKKWHDVPGNLEVMGISDHCRLTAAHQDQRRNSLGQFAGKKSA